MALKDLVAQRSILMEQAIESIISDFVRYDPDEKEIHFTPAAAQLSNKAKVLVYLVALQGWPYVVEDPIPTDAKPAHIEDRVHIPGGTLRPILKDLKDRHLIREITGAYSVRAASLAAVKSELEGAAVPSFRPRRVTKKRGTKAEPENAASLQKPRRTSARKSGLKDKFDGLIDTGFFDQPRSLSDVQNRFHEEAVIIPQTSIPSYLLSAVRSNRLQRERQEVNGKQVWIYKRR
jgi:hypothetical protein